MGKLIYLTGRQFSNWNVIGQKARACETSNNLEWLCRCVCGKEQYVRTDTLLYGTSKSCGCAAVKASEVLTGVYSKYPNIEGEDRRKAYNREWSQRNKDKVAEYNRRLVLRKKYGITVQEYTAMLESQGNRCAICSIHFKAKPDIDHDHSTGKVRGLLCRTCNQGIGLFKESKEILQKAVEYMAKK